MNLSMTQIQMYLRGGVAGSRSRSYRIGKTSKAWKKEGGKVAHLTMYGINIDDIAERLRKESKVLVIIGAEKVPQEAYELADYNIAIGNQPHSEIAALAIFLDRIFTGEQFKRVFADADLKIVPTEKGKKVQENK